MLPPEVWEHTLQLCFEFDFLMDAVLCISARHLAILLPEDETISIVAIRHLCRSLSKFRHILSHDFTSTHVDAFIATSFLVLHEVWANTDFIAPEHDIAPTVLSKDRIFEFSSGMKEVFLRSVSSTSTVYSVFLPHIGQNPTDILAPAAQINSSTLDRYRDFFSHRRSLNSDLLNIPIQFIRDADSSVSNPCHGHIPDKVNALNPVKDGFEPVINGLCLITSFLPEACPPDSISSHPALLPELIKYVFSFPLLCRGQFASLIQQNDPLALLLLYHFYRAVRILLPPSQCWWAHKRAVMSELVLRKWFIKEFKGAEVTKTKQG